MVVGAGTAAHAAIEAIRQTDEHADLLNAIEAADVEGADQLMSVHIANATKDFSLKYRRDPIEEML